MRRQALGKPVPQRGTGHARRTARHHKTRQLGVAVYGRVVDHDRCRGDVRMPGQRRLHFAQLDAETADLDLVVDAAQIVQLAARVEAP